MPDQTSVTSDNAPPRWIGVGYTDGGAGMANQVRGLLKAVGASVELVQAPLRLPWKWLWPGLIPNRDWVFQAPTVISTGVTPDVVVTCGRQSVMASLSLKRRFGDRICTIHTQDPKISPDHFDLVACPEHDGLSGPNVVGTFGAIHHITPQLLQVARTSGPIGGLEQFRRAFTLVLLGGPTRNYPYSLNSLHCFQEKLKLAFASSGEALAILPSKRTPRAWVESFNSRFGEPHFVWTGQTENPYLVGLATASHIVVTCDSVNMISEAAATGSPVYVEMLPERRVSERFHRFYQSFHQAGITRPFEGALESWSYSPPNATQQVADAILEKMTNRRLASFGSG